MIERVIANKIKNSPKGKITILLGARQTGKTTLLKDLSHGEEKVYWMNCDEPDLRQQLEEITSTRFKAIIGDANHVFIDEAQRVKNIGIGLKIINDTYPDLKLIVTGSSALELNDEIQEALTGRTRVFNLFPLSFKELVQENGLLEEKRLLKQRLIYGSYPEVVENLGSEKEVLLHLSDSFLYKDILSLGKIKKPDKLVKLLQALAFQVGNEVSYNELGNLIGLDNESVVNYIDLLEKSFILFRVGSFSRNLRNEIKKSRKVYFYDNGILNSMNNQYSNFESRNDIGALWENYIVSEIIKKNSYDRRFKNYYFWRTKIQQEIDLIEEEDGKLTATEIKFNPKVKVKFSKSFTNSYQDSKLQIINSDNYDEYII